VGERTCRGRHHLDHRSPGLLAERLPSHRVAISQRHQRLQWSTSGVQQLVDVIRGARAHNVITLSGLDMANDPSGLLAHLAVTTDEFGQSNCGQLCQRAPGLGGHARDLLPAAGPGIPGARQSRLRLDEGPAALRLGVHTPAADHPDHRSTSTTTTGPHGTSLRYCG
jgi:hypothetical protein